MVIMTTAINFKYLFHNEEDLQLPNSAVLFNCFKSKLFPRDKKQFD